MLASGDSAACRVLAAEMQSLEATLAMLNAKCEALEMQNEFLSERCCAYAVAFAEQDAAHAEEDMTSYSREAYPILVDEEYADDEEYAEEDINVGEDLPAPSAIHSQAQPPFGSAARESALDEVHGAASEQADALEAAAEDKAEALEAAYAMMASSRAMALEYSRAVADAEKEVAIAKASDELRVAAAAEEERARAELQAAFVVEMRAAAEAAEAEKAAALVEQDRRCASAFYASWMELRQAAAVEATRRAAANAGAQRERVGAWRKVRLLGGGRFAAAREAAARALDQVVNDGQSPAGGTPEQDITQTDWRSLEETKGKAMGKAETTPQTRWRGSRTTKVLSLEEDDCGEVRRRLVV